MRKFISLTQTGEQTAIYCLTHNDWKLDQASDNYFQAPDTYYRELDRKKIELLFQRYRDPNDASKISSDGVVRFLEDLRLHPESKLVLIIAWKFRAETQCEFTTEEFVNGFVDLGVDSIDKLRAKLPQLENDLCDANKFKDFYQFTFNYAKEHAQKGIDLDMAIAYWNIVLQGQFKFLDLWCKFLTVSIPTLRQPFLLARYFIRKIMFSLFIYSIRKITSDPYRRTRGICCWTLRHTSMTTCPIMMRRARGQFLSMILSNGVKRIICKRQLSARAVDMDIAAATAALATTIKQQKHTVITCIAASTLIQFSTFFVCLQFFILYYEHYFHCLAIRGSCVLFIFRLCEF